MASHSCTPPPFGSSRKRTRRTSNDPLEVLTDLFGSDPVDLHGAMIVDAGGLAQLVIERLAEARFLIVPADH
jgi:hypothetical protein